jgi:hypothetical protein
MVPPPAAAAAPPAAAPARGRARVPDSAAAAGVLHAPHKARTGQHCDAATRAAFALTHRSRACRRSAALPWRGQQHTAAHMTLLPHPTPRARAAPAVRPPTASLRPCDPPRGTSSGEGVTPCSRPRAPPIPSPSFGQSLCPHPPSRPAARPTLPSLSKRATAGFAFPPAPAPALPARRLPVQPSQPQTAPPPAGCRSATPVRQ